MYILYNILYFRVYIKYISISYFEYIKHLEHVRLSEDSEHVPWRKLVATLATCAVARISCKPRCSGFSKQRTCSRSSDLRRTCHKCSCAGHKITKYKIYKITKIQNFLKLQKLNYTIYTCYKIKLDFLGIFRVFFEHFSFFSKVFWHLWCFCKRNCYL